MVILRVPSSLRLSLFLHHHYSPPLGQTVPWCLILRASISTCIRVVQDSRTDQCVIFLPKKLQWEAAWPLPLLPAPCPFPYRPVVASGDNEQCPPYWWPLSQPLTYLPLNQITKSAMPGSVHFTYTEPGPPEIWATETLLSHHRPTTWPGLT